MYSTSTLATSEDMPTREDKDVAVETGQKKISITVRFLVHPVNHFPYSPSLSYLLCYLVLLPNRSDTELLGSERGIRILSIQF